MPILPPLLPAVTVYGRSLDGEALRGAAGAVADRVAGAPVVAVDATASLETVVAVVGALLAGVAVVPVPPDSGPAERGHLLHDSGPALWLGEPRDDVAVEAVPIDVTARSSTTHAEPDAGTALIMYTSGTTGAPKGAVLSRRAVIAGLDGVADAWAWTADDVLVHGLPLFHVHGLVLGVLGALRTGSPLIHTGRPTPSAYAAAGAACTSACRRCGAGSRPTPRPRPRSAGPGCWSRAAPPCRRRCSTRSSRRPGRDPSSGTA